MQGLRNLGGRLEPQDQRGGCVLKLPSESGKQLDDNRIAEIEIVHDIDGIQNHLVDLDDEMGGIDDRRTHALASGVASHASLRMLVEITHHLLDRGFLNEGSDSSEVVTGDGEEGSLRIREAFGKSLILRTEFHIYQPYYNAEGE
ncbi:MAG: hypothetical protein ACI8T1_000496 [Verrucomicrobiales bacterium]|jgi:hypothetical protein